MINWLCMRLGIFFFTRIFSVVSIWVPDEKTDYVRVILFADDEFWIRQYQESLIRGEHESQTTD